MARKVENGIPSGPGEKLVYRAERVDKISWHVMGYPLQENELI